MTNLITPTFHLSTPTFEEFFRVVIWTSDNKRCCVSVTKTPVSQTVKVQPFFQIHTFMFGCWCVSGSSIQTFFFLLFISPSKFFMSKLQEVRTDPWRVSDQQHTNLHQGWKRALASSLASFSLCFRVQAVWCNPAQRAPLAPKLPVD